MAITLSLPEARRLAVASQAFSARPAKPSIGDVRKLAARLHAFQIDSVNVLVRAHYVPAFARLGPYPTDTLDSLAYDRHDLFEYWGHSACLLPMSLYPLLKYRMHSEATLEYMRSDRGAYVAGVYQEVAERGPMTVSELADTGTRAKKWWGWGKAKSALEHLYDSGLVAIAGRRRFARLYDLAERVIPRTTLDAPAPPLEEAMKQLICLGAKAYGVGTAGDITGYFETDGWRDRLPAGPWWERPKGPAGRRVKPIAQRLVSELVEEGRLLAAAVDGWNENAYLHPDARVAATVEARAIVTPFDSLVWERRRIERLFGMKYTIELYTPISKRVYGYYVCPFLLGDTLVGRCDLKADRQRQVLMVQSAFVEPGQDARRVGSELAEELRQVQAWLQLDRIEVGDRGDAAAALRRSVRRARQPRNKEGDGGSEPPSP
jgi:uncharacterized protein YcaQ